MTARNASAVVFAVLASTMSPPAPAEENKSYLTVSALSYHMNRKKGYNEVNAGAGVEYELTRTFALVAGFYRNSRPDKDAVSTYGGFSYMPVSLGPLRAGVMLGAVTGYKQANVLPAASGILSLGTRDTAVNVHFLPALSMRYISALGLQFKRSF